MQNWQVFAGVRKEIDGAALVAESNGNIEPVILDVVDNTSVQAAVALVQDRLAPSGRNLSGLVNNAGACAGGDRVPGGGQSWCGFVFASRQQALRCHGPNPLA